MWIRARLRLAMPFVRLPTEVASTLHSTAWRRALRAVNIEPETVREPCRCHVSWNATTELRSAECLLPTLESLRSRLTCAHGYRVLEVACCDNVRVRGWAAEAIAHLEARNAGGSL